MRVNPPGRAVQWLNKVLHREPLSSLSQAFYWTFVFVIAPPMVFVYYQCSLLWSLVSWMAGFSNAKAYHPQETGNMGKELAIVITGCDSGIGRELAIVSAQQGFVVFASCLQKESLKQFDFSTRILPLLVDVTSDDQVTQAAQKVQEWLEKGNNDSNSNQRILHALVNNAGIGAGGGVDWMEIETFQKVMDVNYYGMIRCCKAFLPMLKRQAPSYRGSRILNIASMAGIGKAPMNLSAYCASKHAAAAFSSSLRQELQVFGIQVSTVCPSFHGTPLVHTMQNMAQTQWDKMPLEKQHEYGEGSLAFFQGMIDKAHQFTWSLDTLVEQLENALCTDTVPAEMMIGGDARFGLLLTSMYPVWLFDILIGLAYGKQPLPDCMKKAS